MNKNISEVLDGDFFESFKEYPNVLYSETHKIKELYGKECEILITHNSDWNITEQTQF